MGSIKDKVAIVGMGCSKFGERWDAGMEDLVIESAYEAFADSGVRPEDIEACYLGMLTAPTGGTGGTVVSNALKFRDIPILRNENWCASGHIAMIEACLAVASGAYDTVMAIGVEKLKDTGFPGLGTGRGMTPVLEARRTSPGSRADRQALLRDLRPQRQGRQGDDRQDRRQESRQRKPLPQGPFPKQDHPGAGHERPNHRLASGTV
jgi:acetyl-CoA acetyltransferase